MDLPVKWVLSTLLYINLLVLMGTLNMNLMLLGSWCGQFHFSLLFHNLDLHLCILYVSAYPRVRIVCKLRRGGIWCKRQPQYTVSCFLFTSFFSPFFSFLILRLCSQENLFHSHFYELWSILTPMPGYLYLGALGVELRTFKMRLLLHNMAILKSE